MAQANWRKGNIFSLLDEEEEEVKPTPKPSQTASTTKAAQPSKPAQGGAKPESRPKKAPVNQDTVGLETENKSRVAKQRQEPAQQKDPVDESANNAKPERTSDSKRRKPPSDDRKSRSGRNPNVKRSGAGAYNWGETVDAEAEKPKDAPAAEEATEEPEAPKAEEAEVEEEQPREEDNFVTLSEYLGEKAEEEGKEVQTGMKHGQLLGFKAPPLEPRYQNRQRERRNAPNQQRNRNGDKKPRGDRKFEKNAPRAQAPNLFDASAFPALA